MPTPIDRALGPESAKRIEAAHDSYVTALRALNRLRCAKPRCGNQPDYASRVVDADRRAKEAFAEWVMLFEHETGARWPCAECSCLEWIP